MNWTNDQYSAVYAEPASIVISAAAGSGKTQVLTSRIIERIKSHENPVSIDKLLIVTFTKAAAAEMRERIGKSLSLAVKNETEPDRKAYLSSQLSLLSSAHICTIDSFCFDVVRQNFYEANLPGDISIGDTGELSLLRIDALEKTIDAFYCALALIKGDILNEENAQSAKIIEDIFPDPQEREEILRGFEALTLCYSSDKSDSDFTGTSQAKDYTSMISLLHAKAQSAAFPDKWLDEISLYYDCNKYDYEDTPFFKNTIENCRKMAESMAHMALQCAEFSKDFGLGYESVLFDESEYLKNASKLTDYEALREALLSDDSFHSLPRRKKGTSPEDAEIVKNERKKQKALKEECELLLEFSLSDCRSLQEYLYPRIKALCSAAKVLDKIYYDKMTSRRIIDFSACEHLALKIISPDGNGLSEAGLALRRKYDEIYIDEMQDSNELQNTLFSSISNGRMFMVGDVKQSIYGFRNTDPSIFMQKCNESSFDANAPKRKIFLSKNFRSGKCIVDAVNDAFDKLMRIDTCAIDYINEHRLEFGADFMPSPEKAMCEIDAVSYFGSSGERIHAEADFISDKILEIVKNTKVWDKDTGNMRPAKYSDIAILMRAPSGEAEIYEKIFSEKNIPLYFDGGGNFYNTGEVSSILEMLKLIDNSKCDIPLAASMRSPMFMFNENELAAIRLYSKGSFSEAVEAICKSDEKSLLHDKCISFMKTLNRWREASRFMSVYELILKIYNETNITSAVLSFPDGERRRENLELLLERAAEYEKSSFRGLFNFVNYAEKLKNSGGSTAEAKSISEKMNVVRLMSIHKSKGLEFPIVFIGGCSKHYNKDKSTGGMLLHMKTGISINVTDPILRCRYQSPMQRITSLMLDSENSAEELRLLYVAMTRARERLFAVCSFKEGKSFTNSVFKNISCHDVLLANSYTSLLELSVGDKWQIKRFSEEAASSDNTPPPPKELVFRENKDISEKLSYVYPFKNLLKLPSKASVSFMKSAEINLLPEGDGSLHALNDISQKSVKLQKVSYEKQSSGAFFGTAHHKMLEHLRFDGTSAAHQKAELYARKILTEDEMKIIDDRKIDKFLSSDIASKMADAVFIRREAPFVIDIGADEINDYLLPDERICIQGVIDCYFETRDGKIVLLDYKTDTYDDPEEIALRYSKQIYYYEKALKLKFNDKIIQKYLYLLHKNDIIEL